MCGDTVLTRPWRCRCWTWCGECYNAGLRTLSVLEFETPSTRFPRSPPRGYGAIGGRDGGGEAVVDGDGGVVPGWGTDEEVDGYGAVEIFKELRQLTPEGLS